MGTISHQNQDASISSGVTLSELVEFGVIKKNITPAILATVAKLWSDLKQDLSDSNIETRNVIIDVSLEDAFDLSANWAGQDMTKDTVDNNLAVIMGRGGKANNSPGNKIMNGLTSVAVYGTNRSDVAGRKVKSSISKKVATTLNRNNIPFIYKGANKLYNVLSVENAAGNKMSEPARKIGQRAREIAPLQDAAFNAVDESTMIPNTARGSDNNNSLHAQPRKRHQSDISRDVEGPNSIFADAENDPFASIPTHTTYSNEPPSKKHRPDPPAAQEQKVKPPTSEAPGFYLP